jgi:hypothetical protein
VFFEVEEENPGLADSDEDDDDDDEDDTPDSDDTSYASMDKLEGASLTTLFFFADRHSGFVLHTR